MNPADHQLDLERRSRLGMVEAIWGQDKSAAQIASIRANSASSAEAIAAAWAE